MRATYAKYIHIHIMLWRLLACACVQPLNSHYTPPPPTPASLSELWHNYKYLELAAVTVWEQVQLAVCMMHACMHLILLALANPWKSLYSYYPYGIYITRKRNISRARAYSSGVWRLRENGAPGASWGGSKLFIFDFLFIVFVVTHLISHLSSFISHTCTGTTETRSWWGQSSQVWGD